MYKKIIFVCSEFRIGGVETSFKNLLTYGINTDEYIIELHLLNQKQSLGKYTKDLLHFVNIESEYEHFYRKRTIKDFWNIVKTYGLISWLKRIVIKVLFKLKVNRLYWLGNTLFPNAGTSICNVCIILKENDPCLYYALSKIKAQKYISFFHTADYYSPIYASLYESSKIHQIITVSQGNKDFLLKKMPKLSNKIAVIHNIINPKEIREKASQEIEDRFDNRSFNLISVGRICQEKGIETIIATASILYKNGIAVKWHLVGPFDKDYTQEQFEEEISKNNAKDIFKIVGPKENPYPYMAMADVLVNPSVIESFGMAIRESQILGIPVIATRTYGGNELVEDGVSGLLVGINNAKELAEKIILLMSDKTLYDKIKNYLGNSDFDESKTIKEQFEKVIS